MAYRGVLALAEKPRRSLCSRHDDHPDDRRKQRTARSSRFRGRIAARSAGFGVAMPVERRLPRGRVCNRFFGSAVSSGIESAALQDLPCSAGHKVVIFRRTGEVYACVQLPMPAEYT